MKKSIILFALTVSTFSLFAQKKTTTSAKINFDATTEKDALPKAENNTAVAAIDTKKGTVAFEAQIKGFNFSNASMQDHFNSPKWLDSEKFPLSTFEGKITDLSAINFAKDGVYKVNVKGTFSLHGIEKELSAPSTIEVKKEGLIASAAFAIKLDEFGIGNAGGKVDNNTKITVTAELK